MNFGDCILMRVITTIVVLLLWQGVFCQDFYSMTTDVYSDTLRAIEERLRVSHEQQDLALTAQAYYERGMHNFSAHIRAHDVINDLIESAKIFKNLRDDDGYYKARFALARFYIIEDIFLDESLRLTVECYQYYKSKGDLLNQARALTQLGRVHQHKLDYDKAIAYVEQGLKLSSEVNDMRLILENRLMIAKLLASQGKVEKMINEAKFVIVSGKYFGHEDLAVEANYLVGQVLVRDQRDQEALPYLREAVESNLLHDQMAFKSNDLLSQVYLRMGDVESAYYFLRKANKVTNELYDKERYTLASQNAVKYKTSEREREIKELEQEKQLSAFKLTQRTRFFITMSILFALAVFATYNYYRLKQHRYESERVLGEQKEKLAKQKINDLQNSLKIENLEAVITGQEAERTRISTDLHDSLGGMLSALKLHYDALQVNHAELAHDQQYLQIMDLIDEACKDVRDISRNLKPVALEKLGMTAALKDLVNKYRVHGSLDISINTNQVDGLLSNDAKLHVYRIIQELLNNALKHAQATEIDVIVNRAEDELVIMVQDNGIGFAPEEVQMGLGLGNLRSRVNVLKGEMEIDTSISRGTSVTIRIPIQAEAVEIMA